MLDASNKNPITGDRKAYFEGKPSAMSFDASV
jgi:hypothetical protein